MVISLAMNDVVYEFSVAEPAFTRLDPDQAIEEWHGLSMRLKVFQSLFKGYTGVVFLFTNKTMRNLAQTPFQSLIIGLILALLSMQVQAKEIEAKPMHYDMPSWFKSSFLDIPADVDEARSAGKGLLMFFHLENCPFCAHLLKDNFTTGPNKEKIQRNFDVIGVDVKGDLTVVWIDGKTYTEKELAKKLGAFATPAVFVLGPQHEVVKKVMGYKKPDEFMSLLPFRKQ